MSFRTIILSAFLGISLVAAGLLALYIGLPALAEQRIHKLAGPLLKQHGVTFRIQGIGPARTVVQDISLGPDLTIDQAVLEYRIQGWRRVIPRRLVISGFNVRSSLDRKTGQFSIQGVYPMPGEEGKAGTIPDQFLPLLPREIVFKNSSVDLAAGQLQCHIPFDLSASLSADFQAIDCSAKLHPLGETVNLEAVLDTRGKVSSMKLAAPAFNLAVLEPLLGTFLPPVLLPALSGAPSLALEQVTPSTWDLSVSALFPAGPAGPALRRFNARMLLSDNMVTAAGRVIMSHENASDVPLTGRLRLDLNQGNRFDFNCQNQPVDMWVGQLNNNHLSVDRPLVTLSVAGTPDRFAGTAIVKAAETIFRHQDQTLRFKQAAISASLDGSVSQPRLHMELTSNLSGILLRNKMMTTRFKRADTSGSVRIRPGGPPRVNLRLQGIQGSLDVPSQNLSCRGISANLPLYFPASPESPSQDSSGSFSVPDIVWDNRLHLAGHGQLVPMKDRSLRFEATLALKEAEDLSLHLEGRAGLDKTVYAEARLKTGLLHLTPGVLEDLLPMAWSADYDMEVSADARVAFHDNRLETEGNVVLHGGSLSLPDYKLNARGIRGKLAISDLIAMESVPGQTISIDGIEMGQFLFSDARLRFSLEENRHVLLENARFRWCDGLVSTESVRFPSRDENLSLILYCDRLSLSGLLKQIGAFNAQGDGSLSGRIPVHYADGDISFENGFLYSTPGVGGQVSIGNTEKLTQGIPMDSPQFAQLDLAREALKDFQYEWAKLHLNTEKETLFVNMELDGKPAKLLPFEYKADIASFIRVDAKSSGSRFQGIRLDVNLKLPFNRMVKFGNRLKGLFQ